MAQSSSVAREPSMEEILASIRRIIEESDTTRNDAVPPPAVNSDRPAAPARLEARASEDLELPPREGIALRTSAPAAPTFEATMRHTPAPVAPAPADEIDAAEKQPVIDSPNAFVDERELPSEETAIASSGTEPASEMSLEEARAILPEPIVPGVEVEAAPEDEPQAAHVTEAAPAPVAETFTVPIAEPELTAPPTPVEAVAQPEPAPLNQSADDDVSFELEQALGPIVSEATEREVGSAFDDLQFAVRNEQRRSFDEIAQEIMRPLLQEWLDNNLPTLVERLVREEIERVARGGRR